MANFQTKSIDGVEVTCVAVPEYPRGGRIFAELAYVLMPALSSLGKSIAGKLDMKKLAAATPGQQAALLALAMGDDGVGKVVEAVEGALHRLIIEDPARAERLIDSLASSCTAILPKPGGASSECLNTQAKIQLAVETSGAGYSFLGKLLWFMLEVNFGRPFAGAFAGLSKAAAPPESPIPTP